MERYIIDAPVETKIKLISSMFPEKIKFDGEKYRTNSYNQVLDLIYQETKQLREGNVKKRREVHFSPIQYPDPGSNRDGVPHWCLRPARLPIPPSGHWRFASAKV